MILTALAATLSFAQIPFQDAPVRQDLLLNRDGSEPRLMVRQPQAPMPEPKLSPKTFGENKIRYEYDWITWGFARVGLNEQMDLRFRVYSQERKGDDDTALRVTRMMMRLWDLNMQRLRLDHSQRYHAQLVNVFLTWGGKAGAEQVFSSDIEGRRQVSVNTIYFYDIGSFSDPMEMAREVAHEYGHATLPAVGVYSAPEDWANGYWGEKLYLTWIREMLSSGELEPEDFMGATAEMVDKYFKTKVEPLIVTAAGRRPTRKILDDKSANGMDSFVGLAVYCGQVLPRNVYSRSIRLIGSQSAPDYLEALQLAVEEPEEFEVSVPDYLRGRAIWVPVGRGRVTGATTLKLEEGWAHVQPQGATFKIVSRR
jgi:hypothetical protein